MASCRAHIGAPGARQVAEAIDIKAVSQFANGPSSSPIHGGRVEPTVPVACA
ncbi:MAG: hypothetical protein LBC97_10645 [Bifidobacteriaceae bacterium]|nr:hypothetical protein [Bifidobacteriaceae bacterium]